MTFSCLAIETATPLASVAACHGGQTAQQVMGEAKDSSRQVYKCVSRVLSELSVELKALDCIAFGAGPGAFTGVRVAASAAQALAYAVSLPVCGVSTLATLATLAHRSYGANRIAVSLDARMGEVYFAVYSFAADGDMRVVEADSLMNPDDILLDPSQPGLIAVGSGWSAYPAMLERNAASIEQCDAVLLPDAATLLQLAEAQFAAGNTLAATAALPNYLRNHVTG